MGGRRLSAEELKRIPADNADYSIHNGIAELKIFEEEPLQKKERQDELAAFFKEHFAISTQVDINIKHLTDDAKRGYKQIVGKRIKKAVKKAGKQISATKAALGRIFDFGLLIAVNNGYSSLPHDEFDNLVLTHAKHATSQIDFVLCATLEYHAGEWDSFVFSHSECYPTHAGLEYPQRTLFIEAVGKRFEHAMTEMMRMPCPQPDLSNSLSPVTDIRFERGGVTFTRTAPDADFAMKKLIEEEAKKDSELSRDD